MTLARYDVVVVVDLSALGAPKQSSAGTTASAGRHTVAPPRARRGVGTRRDARGGVGRTHRGDTAVVTPSTVVAIDCIGLDCFVAHFALDWFKSVVVGNDRDGGDDDGG